MELSELLQLAKARLARLQKGAPTKDDQPAAIEDLKKLDNVYVIKVARRLSESHLPNDIRDLTYHFQAIAGDHFWRNTVDADLLRYKCRWETMADVLQASLRITDYAGTITSRHLRADDVPSMWRWIIDQIRPRNEEGIGWSSLLERVNSDEVASDTHPISKSKFSGIVASMKLAGWLRVVPHGRQKTLHLGPAARTEGSRLVTIQPDESAMSLAGRTTDLRLARDIVCGLSGAFISYVMLTSEKHKKLRLAYANAPTNPTTRSQKLLATLKATEGAAADLYSFLSAQTTAVAHASFAYLDQYFDRAPRKGNLERPRISVKLVEPDAASSEVWVLDLARNHQPTGELRRVLTSSNTGFRQVESTGSSFLLNDVPRAIFEGRYENPRLRTQLVHDLSSSELFRSADDLTPVQWRSLWKGAEQPSGFSSAYKSTLIVPITLRNNYSDPDFVKLLEEMTISTNYANQQQSREMDRAILGYLCFDHPDRGYFQQADEDIGYVVADWLSMFLMVRYAHTTLSTTFTGAQKWLKLLAHGRSDELVKLIVADRIASSSKARASVQVWASPAPPRPGCHQPVGLGEFDVEVRDRMAV